MNLGRPFVLCCLAVLTVGGCTDGVPAGGPRPDRGSGAVWVPEVGVSWQWQLSSSVIDMSVDAQVYDVDGLEVDAATVARLHGMGRRVVCYLDVGAWEGYREDAGSFPQEVIGNPVEGWPQERWLDVRRLDVLRPIMAARMDVCREKGFDAVEADMVEAYAEEGTGFEISEADQIAYNRMIAGLAHARGMSVALKNGAGLVPALVDDFDFAVVEECYQYGECEAYLPFIDRGKAVLHVEYAATVHEFCPVTKPLGFSSIRKRPELDAWRQTCP